jgi:hypothetical protein
MWRQVVLPVSVVGISWLTMSIATTCYVLWLDTSYQKMFDENVASATAAGTIQEEIWHLYAEFAEFLAQGSSGRDWASRLQLFEKSVRDQLAILAESTTTAEEHQVTQELRSLTQKYHQQFQSVLASQSLGTTEDRPTNHAGLFAPKSPTGPGGFARSTMSSHSPRPRTASAFATWS